MKLTPAKLAANQANAQKSTGPTSPEGKRTSSRNGIKHGILTQAVLLEGESRDRFTEILDDLNASLRPADANEQILVQTMALAHWRRLRACTLETAAINREQRLQPAPPPDAHPFDRTLLAVRACSGETGHIATMTRYESRYDAQYNRALDRLLKGRRQNTRCTDQTHQPSANRGEIQ